MSESRAYRSALIASAMAVAAGGGFMATNAAGGELITSEDYRPDDTRIQRRVRVPRTEHRTSESVIAARLAKAERKRARKNPFSGLRAASPEDATNG